MVLPSGLFEHVGNPVETERHHHFGTSLEIIEKLSIISFDNGCVYTLTLNITKLIKSSRFSVYRISIQIFKKGMLERPHTW